MKNYCNFEKKPKIDPNILQNELSPYHIIIYSARNMKLQDAVIRPI